MQLARVEIQEYLQDVEMPLAELPIEMDSLRTSGSRRAWAKGLIQTGKKILPRVLKSDAPWHTQAGGVVSPDRRISAIH